MKAMSGKEDVNEPSQRIKQGSRGKNKSRSLWNASTVAGNTKDRVINVSRLERNARNVAKQITWRKHVGKKILALKKRGKNASIN